jgi:hypothetical protein
MGILGRKHIYLPHAQTAIYDSKGKLFLKQGISHQLGRWWMKHVYLRFKRSKCLKGCFYLWITLIKKNYKGSHEMYNAHSYLETDKIQTYKKNTCVGRIGSVVFMICLKKELLRAYASSSSISVLCVITLWQRSNAWQGQSSVQDKFCSKQTQPLLQTDLPLQIKKKLQGFTWDVQCS